MDNIQFCPDCNRLVEWDGYFNRFYCTSCDWRSDKLNKWDKRKYSPAVKKLCKEMPQGRVYNLYIYIHARDWTCFECRKEYVRHKGYDYSVCKNCLHDKELLKRKKDCSSTWQTRILAPNRKNPST